LIDTQTIGIISQHYTKPCDCCQQVTHISATVFALFLKYTLDIYETNIKVVWKNVN